MAERVGKSCTGYLALIVGNPGTRHVPVVVKDDEFLFLTRPAPFKSTEPVGRSVTRNTEYRALIGKGKEEREETVKVILTWRDLDQKKRLRLRDLARNEFGRIDSKDAIGIVSGSWPSSLSGATFGDLVERKTLGAALFDAGGGEAGDASGSGSARTAKGGKEETMGSKPETSTKKTTNNDRSKANKKGNQNGGIGDGGSESDDDHKTKKKEGCKGGAGKKKNKTKTKKPEKKKNPMPKRPATPVTSDSEEFNIDSSQESVRQKKASQCPPASNEESGRPADLAGTEVEEATSAITTEEGKENGEEDAVSGHISGLVDVMRNLPPLAPVPKSKNSSERPRYQLPAIYTDMYSILEEKETVSNKDVLNFVRASTMTVHKHMDKLVEAITTLRLETEETGGRLAGATSQLEKLARACGSDGEIDEIARTCEIKWTTVEQVRSCCENRSLSKKVRRYLDLTVGKPGNEKEEHFGWGSRATRALLSDTLYYRSRFFEPLEKGSKDVEGDEDVEEQVDAGFVMGVPLFKLPRSFAGMMYDYIQGLSCSAAVKVKLRRGIRDTIGEARRTFATRRIKEMMPKALGERNYKVPMAAILIQLLNISKFNMGLPTSEDAIDIWESSIYNQVLAIAERATKLEINESDKDDRKKMIDAAMTARTKRQINRAPAKKKRKLNSQDSNAADD